MSSVEEKITVKEKKTVEEKITDFIKWCESLSNSKASLVKTTLESLDDLMIQSKVPEEFSKSFVEQLLFLLV
jgi:hypothetical protein